MGSAQLLLLNKYPLQFVDNQGGFDKLLKSL